MTKAELAKAIARTQDLNHKEAVRIVDAVLETISQSLTRGEKVELRGFGSFGIKRKAGRTARNPKTGTSVKVPAKVVATFKASKSFKKVLDNNAAKPETETGEKR